MLYQPKTYQINLDLDPSDRWTAIGKDYAEHVQALLKVVIGVVNKIDDKLVPFVLKVSFLYHRNRESQTHTEYCNQIK